MPSIKVLLAVLVLLSLTPAALYSMPRAGDAGKMQAAVTENSTVNWTNQQVPVIRMFLSPSPTEYMQAIDKSRQILRAKIMLNESRTVEFYERPKSIDFYNSTIVVSQRGGVSRSYNVGALIKHQALSLAHVGIVPLQNGAGMLVCEYEGGAVGAREGFAILRYSSSGFKLHTLPLTSFGKVVVFRSNPKKAEIWSALPNDVGADAEPMFYTTRSCLWKKNRYECSSPKRKRSRYAPAAIDQPGIEIQP